MVSTFLPNSILKVMWGALPTINKLALRGIVGSICFGCKAAKESLVHLFLECPFLGSFYNFFFSWLVELCRVKLFKIEFVLGGKRNLTPQHRLCLCITRFHSPRHVWLSRNKRVFENEIPSMCPLGGSVYVNPMYHVCSRPTLKTPYL